ncbi:MAG: ADP-ribosylglycohydrolase family protein [Acidimicrobiales bacterium]
MQMSPIELDRGAGVLVAAAAGDALGAGYEFGPPCGPDVVEMRQGALTGRPPGAWTDDTDMAICIAKAASSGLLLDSQEGLASIAQGFLDWYASHPPDMGIQTRSVLSSTKNPKLLAQAAAKYQESHPNAAGNGSLMRTAPVALAHLGNDAHLASAARAVSSLTHPHYWATDACVLWCFAIDRAIREGRLNGIADGLDFIPEERRSYWEDVLAISESAPLRDLRDNGFVVTALQAAWRAIVSTADAPSGPAHLEAALRAAVAIGGDTDTVAAIAGALLGARYGASSVPFAWRRNLRGWPPEMRHADLVGLAALALRGGKPDAIGWPVAPNLMTYYERNWQPKGTAIELPDHPGVIWGDLAALASVDANAFISLCRVGTDQRRGDDHHQVWLMDSAENADLGFVLSDTADAVESLRREHRTVFVHCVRCESRTPAVAAAWLIRHRARSYENALEEVQDSMPTSNPNTTMREALRAVSLDGQV